MKEWKKLTLFIWLLFKVKKNGRNALSQRKQVVSHSIWYFPTNGILTHNYWFLPKNLFLSEKVKSWYYNTKDILSQLSIVTQTLFKIFNEILIDKYNLFFSSDAGGFALSLSWFFNRRRFRLSWFFNFFSCRWFRCCLRW